MTNPTFIGMAICGGIFLAMFFIAQLARTWRWLSAFIVVSISITMGVWILLERANQTGDLHGFAYAMVMLPLMSFALGATTGTWTSIGNMAERKRNLKIEQLRAMKIRSD